MAESREILRGRTVIGTPREVNNVVINTRSRGALVRFTAPERLNDGRVLIEMVTREARPSMVRRTVDAVRGPAVRPATPIYARPRTWVTAGAVSLGLAALAGVGYALYLAYLWVVAHFAVIVGCVLLAIVALGLLVGRSSGGHWHHGRGC